MNVLDYLEQEPRFRERRFKNRGLVDVCTDFTSMDRQWRAILEKREDLRGSDYNEKEALVNRKQQELGYR